MELMFQQFIEDKEADDMYITGQAGTGKTTDLAMLVNYCKTINQLCIVTAFTHKACDILRAKLPIGTNVQTLHKFLKKRPTVNQEAKHHKHITKNAKFGTSEAIPVLFIDEYSMVGEKDLMDIRALQDEECSLKVVYLGDPNQLPPVGDYPSVVPSGNYCVTLTKVYRQAADNPLIEPLNQLISAINGEHLAGLTASDKFVRNQDIVEWYNNDRMSDDFDGVMLAFTNRRVQELNSLAQGYTDPKEGDLLFSPTTKTHYQFIEWVDPSEVTSIIKPFGDEELLLDSKYKTLEYLFTQDYKFARIATDEDEFVAACVFGHYDYQECVKNLKKAAAQSNNNIANTIQNQTPAQWAQQNSAHTLAKDRAKAWRAFLAFNESVICLDFAHAMTVHKSQGSTYNSIYLDTKDLSIAADIHYETYLKLMYVAISRASNKVITT